MNIFRRNQGAIAPLAVMFTMISLIYTLSYLTKVVSQNRLKDFRYAKKKALLMAETGLNKVALDEIAYVKQDTVLIGENQRIEFSEDENNAPLGKYGDMEIFIVNNDISRRQNYYAMSVGYADVKNVFGEIVEVKDTVWAQFEPNGFEDYMYFTDKEESSGPPNSDWNGTVNFGGNDSLEGRIHTNGEMSFSQYGCPEFYGNDIQVTLGDLEGGYNLGGCTEDIFLDDEGNSFLDTIPEISFPPNNTVEVVKSKATRTFPADILIGQPGSARDTLIMTEIEFMENGYEVKQWYYQVPPVSEQVMLSYKWDETSTNINVLPGGVHLYKAGAPDGILHWDPDTGYGEPNSLIIDDYDTLGVEAVMLDDVIIGDQIRVQSADGIPKSFTFTVISKLKPNNDRFMFGISNFIYNGNTGFLNDEPVTVMLLDETGELSVDVEWNIYQNYHDHPNSSSSVCRADGFHHWDYAGFFDNASFEIMPPTFFQYNNQFEVLYVRGGQVLVKGIVDGRYTIVTDAFIEYRRPDHPDWYDRVWGNIWIMDDVVYIDSYPSGEVVQPNNGGTENVLGLVAGGNIIVANTFANGARNSAFGTDVRINASLIAMNEAFLSQYWQNTVTVQNCGIPNPSVPYNSLGDGRGRYRNPYAPQIADPVPNGTGSIDFRGKIILWGSVVQQKRGYIKRNNPGPYNSGDIGYDKYYKYDWNLRDFPPPFFPTLETSNGATVLSMKNYGKLKIQ